MQTKCYMTKLIKPISQFLSWIVENIWRQWKLDRITATKILKCFRTNNVGNEEIDLKKENLFSRQNTWNSKKTAAVLEDKLVNQREVLRGGIRHIYLSLSNKWKPCYGAINSWPCNLRTFLKKYWNSKQLGVKAREEYIKLWELFPTYIWNYACTFENVFTAWLLVGTEYCKKIGY